MLAVGQPAPPLQGPTDQDPFDLNNHRGHPVIIYFYPKDMTPGCTTESCDFRDRSEDLRAQGIIVAGVSRDSASRHAKFREKHGLNFPLIADVDGAITEAWGVWREKKNYGRSYMGIVRATFLIDAQGRIARIWDGVRVKGHAEEVAQAARALLRPQ